MITEAEERILRAFLGGPSSIRNIAEKVKKAKTTVQDTVERLERKKLIKRTPYVPKSIRLTKAGRELL